MLFAVLPEIPVLNRFVILTAGVRGKYVICAAITIYGMATNHSIIYTQKVAFRLFLTEIYHGVIHSSVDNDNLQYIRPVY